MTVDARQNLLWLVAVIVALALQVHVARSADIDDQSASSNRG